MESTDHQDTHQAPLPPPNLRDTVAKRMQAVQSTTALVLTYDEAMALLIDLDEAKLTNRKLTRLARARGAKVKEAQDEVQRITIELQRAQDELVRMSDEYQKQANVMAARGQQIKGLEREVYALQHHQDLRDRENLALNDELSRAISERDYYAENASRQAQRRMRKMVRDAS